MAGLANSILVRVLSSDLGGFMVFNIYEQGTGNASSGIIEFPAINGGGAQDMYLAFADFEAGRTTVIYNATDGVETVFTPGAFAADFANVGAITAIMSGVEAIDFSVSLVGSTNIPQPMTLSLLGVGLLVIVALTRPRARDGERLASRM
jgi:hypothetical protein